MRAIEASDLVRWADQKDCGDHLPELVRRLIKETCVSIILESVFGGEPTLLTQDALGSAWAPEEPAYWVMSSAGSPSRAADLALARWKEASRYPAVGKRELVFVTLRRWTGMQRWAKGAKPAGGAGNIRVYDARDLARWLAQAPETTRWFLEEVLKEQESAALETAEVTPEVVRRHAADLVEIWRRLGTTMAGLTDRDALPRFTALTTVRGAFDHADLRRIAKTLPDLGFGSPENAARLSLREAVPPAPDLVGAAFVVEVLGMRPDRAPEWLWAAIDGVEADALPRLERLAYDAEVRLGIREPRLSDWLVTMVESHPDRAPRLAPHLVDYWLPIGLVPFYTAIAQAMLTAARDESERLRCLVRLAQCQLANNDYGTALRAAREAVTLGRKLAQADPERFEDGLASALNRLSVIYWYLVEMAKALATSCEAVDIYRRLAAANPARFEANLAGCLHNLSISLSEAGDKPGALEAVREAVEIYRRQTMANPARFEAGLAGCLRNLSLWLSQAGDKPGALEAIREAVDIYRRLAAVNPARFEADLAGCLHDLSFWPSEGDDNPGGLEAIREAIKIARRLAASNPTRFEADLARCLNSLSIWLSEARDMPTALEAIREAVEIFRRLAAVNPVRVEADLAGCLHNLSFWLSQAGDKPGALEAVREAVDIYRRLSTTDPARFGPSLINSLRLLSNALSNLKHVEEARAALHEANTLEKGTPKLPKPLHTPPPLTIDPLRLAYLLVLDNRAPPPLLLRPDAEAMADAMAAVEADAGGDLNRVVAGLEERHSDAAPHPLWLAWMEETQPGLADRLKGEIPALWAKRGGPPPPA